VIEEYEVKSIYRSGTGLSVAREDKERRCIDLARWIFTLLFSSQCILGRCLNGEWEVFGGCPFLKKGKVLKRVCVAESFWVFSYLDTYRNNSSVRKQL